MESPPPRSPRLVPRETLATRRTSATSDRQELEARAGYAADGSASMTMKEPASSSANPSFLPSASPSTHSGSVPGSGCGGMTTSKCGDQAAALQTTNSDDAKPSDGSADGRKGSGDSGGQNSNSTGKSEAANDTATTVRACRGAGNPTSEKYAAHRASPDNSSGDTDHGSGGGSNDDNDEASPAREEQGQQGSNMKPSCFRAHPKASQHSRAFECGPSSSGDGDEGGGGGGSSESKHEPDHQRSQKRFAPQHSNVQSGYQYELSGGCKEARGPSSASENDASTGSDQALMVRTINSSSRRRCRRCKPISLTTGMAATSATNRTCEAVKPI